MRPSSLKKRQRYLEVATELFLEQGYENTGLDQLISRCGGSKLTIYSYFGDKQGLLKAVVTELTEQLWEAVKFKAVAEEPIKQQLMQFACSYLAFMYNPSALKLCRLVLTQAKNDTELVDYFLKRGAYHSQSALLAFLEEQNNSGLLHIDDSFLACEELLGMLKGNRYFEALFSSKTLSEQERKHYAEHVVNAFLRSYQ